MMKNKILALLFAALLALAPEIAAAASGTWSVKDANAVTRTFDVVIDASGNYVPETVICDGTNAANCAAVTTAHALQVICVSGCGNGTVTSAGIAFTGSAGSLLTETGSPVVNSGVVTIGLQNQNSNCFVGGPISGSATAPTCRALGAADLPSTVPITTKPNNFTATQSTTPTVLTPGATIHMTWGTGGSQQFVVTLNSNSTFAIPAGTIAGTCVLLEIDQPATGGPFTATFPDPPYTWSSGVTPVLSTTTSAADVFQLCGSPNGSGLIRGAYLPKFS